MRQGNPGQALQQGLLKTVFHARRPLYASARPAAPHPVRAPVMNRVPADAHVVALARAFGLALSGSAYD